MRRPNGGSGIESLKAGLAHLDPPALRARPGAWLWIPVVLFALFFINQAYVLVGAGERAVIFNRFTGVQHDQLGEGLHLLLPWIQSPTVYDVKTHAYTMAASEAESSHRAGDGNDALQALTADGLPVSLDISVLFHVDPDRVWRLHREIGPLYLEKVVRPQVHAQVRMIVAQYPVIDVYGGRRGAIIAEINGRLKRLFAQNYLVLDEILVRDVRFSAEFQQAIEQKQVAQQEVQRMKFVLDQADKERRRKIIEAEGEAESIRLKAAALARNPQLVEWEYVKNLPRDVRTVITDGRSIVNMGDALKPEVAAGALNGGGR
jgi:prohibitin 2